MNTMISSSPVKFALGSIHPDPCPECGGKLILEYGRKYGPYYRCEDRGCEGAAGAHRDGKPLGRAAPKAVRELRTRAHELVAILQQQKHWSRSELYAWMIKLFGTEERGHISNMFEPELRLLFREAQKELKYK
jgi:zinc-finger-containing domain